MIKYDKKVLEKTLEFRNFFRRSSCLSTILIGFWAPGEMLKNSLARAKEKSFRLKIVSFAIIP